jgi:hypothetical protein
MGRTGEAKSEKEILSFPQSAAERNLGARTISRAHRRARSRAPGLSPNHAGAFIQALNLLHQFRPWLGTRHDRLPINQHHKLERRPKNPALFYPLLMVIFDLLSPIETSPKTFPKFIQSAFPNR